MHNIQPDNRLQSLIRDDRADIIYKKGNYTNTYLMAEIDGLPTDEILYLGYLDDNDEFVQLYSPFDTNGHYRRTACTSYTPSSNSASQSLSNYFLDLSNYYFYQFDSDQNAGDVSQLNVTEEDELTITDNRGSQLMNQYSFSDINHYTLDLYMKAPKRSIYNGKDFGIRIGDTNNYLSIFFGYYSITATVNNGETLFQSGKIVNAVNYTHIVITRNGNTFSVDYNDGEYVGTCEVNVDIENKLGFYDVNWSTTNTIYIKDVAVKSAVKNAIQLPAQYNADFSFWEDFAADSYDWVLHLPESNNFAEHNYPVAVDIIDFDTFEMVDSVIFPSENLTAKTRTYVNTIPESTDLLTTNATYDASTGIITYPPSDIDDLSVGEHTQLITGATNQLLKYEIKNPLITFDSIGNKYGDIIPLTAYFQKDSATNFGYDRNNYNVTWYINNNPYKNSARGESTYEGVAAYHYIIYLQDYTPVRGIFPPGTYSTYIKASSLTDNKEYVSSIHTLQITTEDCTLTLENDATEQGAATITNPRTLFVTYKWQDTPITNANIQIINLDNNSIAATGTTNNQGEVNFSVTSGGTYQAQAIDYDDTVLLSSTSCNIEYDAIFTVNPYGATYYNNNNVTIQYDDVNNEMYTIGVHSSQMIDEFTPSTNYKFSFDYKPDGLQRCNIFYGFNPDNTNLNAKPTIRIGGDITSTDWYNVDVRTCTSGNVSDCDNTMIYLAQKLENVATNQWIHIDIVRQNNLVSVYVNNTAWVEDYTVPFTLHNSFGFWKWGLNSTQVRFKNFTIESIS